MGRLDTVEVLVGVAVAVVGVVVVGSYWFLVWLMLCCVGLSVLRCGSGCGCCSGCGCDCC